MPTSPIPTTEEYARLYVEVEQHEVEVDHQSWTNVVRRLDIDQWHDVDLTMRYVNDQSDKRINELPRNF